MTQPESRRQPSSPFRGVRVSRRGLVVGLVVIAVVFGFSYWRYAVARDRFSPTSVCGRLHEKDAASVRAGNEVDPADGEQRRECVD